MKLRPRSLLKIILTGMPLVVAAQNISATESAAPIIIRYENHHFTPITVTVPAGKALVIRVINASRERIEFESFKLNREEVVSPGDTLVVHLPALRAGTYDFFDDFHSDVPEGSIVAR
jgi:hypothetical protein